MKQYSVLLFTLLLTILAAPCLAFEAKVLQRTGKSWDGAPIFYSPQNNAFITAVRITLDPGEKMHLHCHPVPTLGYVISGALRVTTEKDQSHEFKQGDVIIEVVDTYHYGENLSKIDPVELIVFYAGKYDLPTTFMKDDGHKGVACGT